MSKTENFPKMTEADLGSLLHSTVFSLQRAIQEASGKSAIVISSHAANFISTIEQAKGTALFSGKTIEDAIEKFVKFIDKTIFFDSVKFERLDEEEFKITILGCALAKGGVHRILNPQKDICPIAMVAAAVLKHHNPDADVMIGASEFSEFDSITTITCLNYKV